MGFKKLGHHFFQNLTPDAESSTPTFDFRSTGAGDFVSVSKDLASKDESPENVAWLQLSSIGGQGSLASSVYRVNPAGGVADSTVSPSLF